MKFLSFCIIPTIPSIPESIHDSSQPLPRNIRNRNNKFDKNITKRGAVPVGKAAERTEESHVPKALIFFFLFVVVGSSLVQVFNMFSSGEGPPPPIVNEEE